MTTPGVALLVPIQVEALVVNASDRRATTWSVTARTYTGAGRLLPLEPPPFARDNDRPRIGVTLHWILPDALTVGRWRDAPDGRPEMVYPYLPDRWLVVRTTRLPDTTGTPIAAPRAWVVESNHAGPDGTNPFPLPDGGLDRLGRSFALDNWPDNSAPPPSRVIGLTAVGPTTPVEGGRDVVYDFDPGYAASIAGIDDVLSFHDDLSDLDTTDDPAATLSYAVIGWYADPATADPMVDRSRFGRDLAAASMRGPLSVDDWRMVMDTLRWSVGDDQDLRQARLSVTDDPGAADAIVPTHTVCHGVVYGVRWHGFTGAPQTFTSGADSAFSGSAIRSRAGWRNPVDGTPDREFGDIDGGPKLGDAASLRRPGGAADAPQHRARFPHLAVGTSTTDALAALFEFLLGHEEGSDEPSDLVTLFQALEHDMLDAYEAPGGVSQIGRRLHQDGFVPHAGGRSWEVVVRRADDPLGAPATMREPRSAPAGLDLVRALDRADRSLGLGAALTALDEAEREVDRQHRRLIAQRRELYSLWWKKSRRTERPTSDEPTAEELGAELARLTSAIRASIERPEALGLRHALGELSTAHDAVVAKIHPDVVGASLRTVLHGDPDSSLELVETPAARYFAPADPIVVISGGRASDKHGGDGRNSTDGTLLVRFGRPAGAADPVVGQTLRYRIDQSTSIGVSDIIAPFFGDLFAAADGLPSATADLLAELILLDAGTRDERDDDVGWSTSLVELLPTEIERDALTTVLHANQRVLWSAPTKEQGSIAAVTRAASFVGVRPSPVGVEAWAQPWRPLYLAWRATWYPADDRHQNHFAEWSFDGDDHLWSGLGRFDHTSARTLQGRCLLGGTSTRVLVDAVDAILERLEGAAVNPQETAAQKAVRLSELSERRALLESVKERLGSADLLAQALTGFHDQLILRDATQYVEPDDVTVSGLLGDVARSAPMPFGDSDGNSRFFPTRAGHARLQRVWLVDAFGQVFDVIHEQGQSPESFVPIRGRGTATVGETQRADTQMLQFGPRLIQPSRLQFRFETGEDGQVAGWLLPNHLDDSVMVYDGGGTALGALLLWHEATGDDSVRWEPTPGRAEPTTPASIGDARLRSVVEGLDGYDRAAFVGFIQAIDRTLWTIDPLGQRGDNKAVLIGRPIAVVGASLSIELDGPAIPDQLWDLSLGTDVAERTAHVTALRVPVRLGLPDSRDDGTVGYFVSGSTRFHSVLSSVDTASDYIVASERHKWPRLPVREHGATSPAPLDMTLLVDPRGSINASTGLLPNKSLRLPRSFVEAPLARLDASFRVGPILTGRTVRMPLPTDIAQGWSWIEKTGVEFTSNGKSETWSAPVEVEASATDAHLNDAPTRLREGWLRLSDVVNEQPTPGVNREV